MYEVRRPERHNSKNYMKQPVIEVDDELAAELEKVAPVRSRASAALPLLDDDTASPASRRLASARPALAPKCEFISAQALTSTVRL